MAYIFVAVEDVNFAAPETSMGHRASVPILENIVIRPRVL
jgi:hypothetical protein